MRFIKHFLALTAICLLSLSHTPADAVPPSASMRWAMQSAVMVHVHGIEIDAVGTFTPTTVGGSGIAIGNFQGTTQILTAAHVCAHADQLLGPEVHIITHGKKTLAGEIVALDYASDACLVNVVGTIPALDIALEMPVAGSMCAIVGAPGRNGGPQAWPVHDYAFINGPADPIVMSGHIPYDRVWEITAELVGGWSGAGVVCASRVVGMVFAIDTSIGELAYIIKADYLRSFLALNDPRKTGSVK